MITITSEIVSIAWIFFNSIIVYFLLKVFRNSNRKLIKIGCSLSIITIGVTIIGFLIRKLLLIPGSDF
jgi:hypothetical protein